MGSLLAAAGSWDSLAAELATTAETYESVLSGLTSLDWRGPASEAMAATAAHHIAWLETTAEQTKWTAMQARAAAAAYELAHAMTVPPAAVTANRDQLVSLIATNFFGQNTPAIAATEAQYAEYWAQDAAAMYGYAADSAAATRLPPFSTPRQTANPVVVSAQNAAVNQANAHAGAPASQALSAGQTLPTNGILPEDFTLVDGVAAGVASIGEVADLEAFPEETIGAAANLGLLAGPGTAVAPPALFPPALFASAPQPNAASVSGLDNVAATLARANTIGAMSVPPSWTTPSGGPVTALPGSDLPALPGTELAGSNTGTSGIPGVPGARVSRATCVVPRYGARLTVMARPPAAG